MIHAASPSLNPSADRPPVRNQQAFTLVELLVACAVFAFILVLMAVCISQMSSGIRNSTAKVEAFQGARECFETINRTLASATLNTYWDYFNSAHQPRTDANSSKFSPALYGRQSDLLFVVTNVTAPTTLNFGQLNNDSPPIPRTQVGHGIFFQAPLGYTTNSLITNAPGGLLTRTGFFVAYGTDPKQASVTGLQQHPRFRLYQFIRNTETTYGYSPTTGVVDKTFISPGAYVVQSLADNILAMVVRTPTTNSPTIATNYYWDSSTPWGSAATQPFQMNQLPPFVNLTMVAVEEVSVNRRLVGGATASPEAASQSIAGVDVTKLFATPDKYDADLATLTNSLNKMRVPYRVFTTTVALPGSKWSP